MAERKKTVWSWKMKPVEADRDKVNLVGQPVRAYSRPGRPEVGIVTRTWWESENTLMVEMEVDEDLIPSASGQISVDLRGAGQETLRALHRAEWWKRP